MFSLSFFQQSKLQVRDQSNNALILSTCDKKEKAKILKGDPALFDTDLFTNEKLLKVLPQFGFYKMNLKWENKLSALDFYFYF